MRAATALLRDRRILVAIALAVLAAGVFMGSRGAQEAVSARISEPVASTAAQGAPQTQKLDPSAAEQSSPAPRVGFAAYQDYFNRDFYASYSYASPAVAPAEWGRPASEAPSAPQSAFTLPSIAEVLDPAKLLPNVPLSVPSAAALPELSKLAPAIAAAPPRTAPAGLLTNNTPFHLFVTSDPVSAASATASDPNGIVSSGGGSAASGAVGTVSGTAGSVAATAGSLLHK